MLLLLRGKKEEEEITLTYHIQVILTLFTAQTCKSYNDKLRKKIMQCLTVLRLSSLDTLRSWLIDCEK